MFLNKVLEALNKMASDIEKKELHEYRRRLSPKEHYENYGTEVF